MTVDTVDVFSPVELYLLLSPLETKYLFGIPDKLTFLLKGEDVFAEGFERLKSKGILTDTGELTDGGGFLIESLMEYHQSKKYVRMNQLMFAFSEKASNEVLVMIEVTSQKEYRFERMNKIYALAMIKDFFPLVNREPGERETEFLKEELTNEERKRAVAFEPEKNFISMEFFHMEEEPKEEKNDKYYKQYLAFEMEDKLMMVDVVNEAYYRGSQYALMKLLFDELELPYKGDD
ncbi:DUF5081 family protein [Listeria welshimeri]|uniref:DUF5081 domain-containing protein n=1 Tax=Listeria welshimeri TaxID=1643 RepID=A0ABX4ICV6_LISWE|nr:DUF5081 family protein [Listeria welshimeri]MBC1244416.1 DUF5081 family protein [Listeria welshimeri]MBC1360722.1 DUF5081 family protein [Listeria welshimeri]MBC1466516.1 DUF5081 family protein [Listeria welshimeri]MBC1519026.1 DUF5081 family protein [Listeria welshimeri]MBC1608104.1 DUF5081 family protein [Listeria welshimeri]